MWLILKKLTMANFMSYGQVPQEIDLNTNTSRLILGDNRDIGTPGKSRNGVGKSSTFNGILFALFGKGVDKELKSDEYVNFANGKRLSVSLEFSVNGADYRVTRNRKPSSIILERLDGDEIVSLTKDSMANTDKAIADLIGYTYEVFVMLYFLSPSKKSFMAMGGAEQRDMIEKILSLDVLVKRSETLKLMLKEFKAEKVAIQKELEKSSDALEEWNKNTTSVKTSITRWEWEKSDKINDLELILKSTPDVDETKIKEIIEHNNAVAEETEAVDRSISEIKGKLSKIHYQIDPLDAQVDSTKNNIAVKMSSLENWKDQIKAIASKLEEPPTIEELETALGDVKKSDALKHKIRELTSNLEVTNHKLEWLESQIDESTSTIEHQKEANKEAERIQQSIEHHLASMSTESELEETLSRIAEVEKKANMIQSWKGLVDSKNNHLENLIATIESEDENLQSLKSGKCPTCGGSHVDSVKVEKLSDKIDGLVSTAEGTGFEVETLESKISQAQDGEYLKYSAMSRGDVEQELKSVRKLTRDLENTKTVNYADEQSKVDDLMVQAEAAQKDKARIESEISQYHTQIKQLSNNDLTADEVNEAINEIKILQRDLEHAKQSRDSLASEVDDLNSKLADLKSDQDMLYVSKEKLENEIDELGYSKTKTVRKFEKCDFKNTDDLAEYVNRRNENIKKLEEKQSEKNPHTAYLEMLGPKPDISDIETRDRMKDEEIKHTEYMVRLLTDNKSFIRKGIVGQYLEFFNRRLLEYTKALGLPHFVQLNDDMSVEIEYMRKSASYYNMSAGERLRLNASATAAFKDMIGMLGKSCNLMMVDEFVDGSLDPEGMYKSFNFLKSISDSLLLISHRPELTDQVDGTIMVIKENGFSRFGE